MNDRAQRVVVNSAGCSWRPVASAVPQRSLLIPVVFSMFIIDLNEGMERTLSKFADDIKLGAAAGIPSGCAALQ